MRKIKFRGKRLWNDQWVYGLLYTIHCIHVDQIGLITIDPETIGQFTGLHDKDGTELYEGDVVKFHGTNSQSIGEIYFNKDRFSMKKYEHLELCSNLMRSKMKVIGNIHELEMTREE